MSIINDALKKVQNNLESSPEKKTVPVDTASAMTNGAQEFSSSATEPAPSSAPAAPGTVSAAMKTSVVKAKDTSMTYILGALCLLIALFAPILNHQSVFGLITHQKNKVPVAAASAAAHSRPATITSTVAQKAASIKEELTRSLVNFNNPSTAPSSHSSSGQQHIVLSGILMQGNKNVALIDGQVYETGEMIDKVKIVAINPNGIVVEENGEQRTIKVGQ